MISLTKITHRKVKLLSFLLFAVSKYKFWISNVVNYYKDSCNIIDKKNRPWSNISIFLLFSDSIRNSNYLTHCYYISGEKFFTQNASIDKSFNEDSDSMLLHLIDKSLCYYISGENFFTENASRKLYKVGTFLRKYDKKCFKCIFLKF